MTGFKVLLLTLMVLSATGCSTFTSLSASNAEIVHRVKQKRTYCHKVTKVYGGAALSICSNFHSGYDRASSYVPLTTESELVDFFSSIILDTLVLPYTIYEQVRYGSVVINNHN